MFYEFRTSELSFSPIGWKKITMTLLQGNFGKIIYKNFIYKNFAQLELHNSPKQWKKKKKKTKESVEISSTEYETLEVFRIS